MIKIKTIGVFLVISCICFSCVSVPREVLVLSKSISQEMVSLHKSHRNFVDLYYKKIENNIKEFIDDVYIPYIINHVLKDELDAYKKGKESLYGDIKKVGQDDNKEYAKKALETMQELQEAFYHQVELKREELLSPIIKQKEALINDIDESYNKVLRMNMSITSYLKSVQEVKKSQEKAMSILGLDKDERDNMMNNLIKTSKFTDDALKKAKEIDVKSDDAIKQIEQFSKQIKSIIKK